MDGLDQNRGGQAGRRRREAEGLSPPVPAAGPDQFTDHVLVRKGLAAVLAAPDRDLDGPWIVADEPDVGAGPGGWGGADADLVGAERDAGAVRPADTRDQALEMAQKADVVIYTISTNMTRIETGGDKVLKYFAAETGGLSFFPFKATDLEQSFQNIANELRHQYNLFYRPEPLIADGKYHSVQLKVKGRKDLVVRSRKGYYAPKL